LARAARDAGFEVIVAARVNNHREVIEREGFRLIPIRLARGSTNIASEFLTILELMNIYRRERPDIVHQVALKPVLYGTWAAKIVGVPIVVNLLAGITEKFHAQRWKSLILGKLVEFGYRLAFWRMNQITIFQNVTDMQKFLERGIVKKSNVELIRGSGVDTSRFVDSPESDNAPVVALASRMLWAKGVGEFVEAAKQFRTEGIKCRMVLVGSADSESPDAVPEATLKSWQAEGIVEWWGHRGGMPEVYSQAHIVCLPSYHEGAPKVLLEAASCGRAIVTTDVSGCKEIVRHGENGLLVAPKDPAALAGALKTLIQNPDLRRQMGRRGRQIVLEEFSDEIVVGRTMALYRRLLSGNAR
jgi:glycosyltransferase involved in cell wall biosynthesis